jgi:hypothetical protein
MSHSFVALRHGNDERKRHGFDQEAETVNPQINVVMIGVQDLDVASSS